MTDSPDMPAGGEPPIPAPEVQKAAPADKSWLEMDDVRGEPWHEQPTGPQQDACE